MKKRMFEISVIRYSRTLYPSRHSRMILSGIQNLLGVLVILVCVSVVEPAEGFIIELPKEGQTIVIGEPFTWRIRLEPEEVCETINLEHYPFNSGTRTYEWTEVVKPEDHIIGRQNSFLTGEPMETCDDSNADVTLNFVLPPTTVVKKISAWIDAGQKKGFLTLYKHDNGKLILTGFGTSEVTAGASYSDGEGRDITNHPDTTYTSSDEKVLKVTPPGKWVIDDRFPHRPAGKDTRPGMEALVTAVGPGTAKIIVRHGPYEDSVTGIVDVEPCSEWKKTGSSKNSLPVCD